MLIFVLSGVVIPNTSQSTYGGSPVSKFPPRFERICSRIHISNETNNEFTGRGQYNGYLRGVHAHGCIMGNQGKMARNSKICIRIRSQLILPEFICLMLSL